MSWMQDLFETYEANLERSNQFVVDSLQPIAHSTQQAHLEVVIDEEGNFKRASVVAKDDAETLIPVTVKSSERTSGISAHPLCDKIQYCAGDYKARNGQKVHGYAEYCFQLKKWCASEFAHPKAQAVLRYIEKSSLIADGLAEGVLVADAAGNLLLYQSKKGEKATSPVPEILKVLTPKPDGTIDQGDAMVRWRVERQGEPCSGTWEDLKLVRGWQSFEANTRELLGFCMVSGQERPFPEGHLHPGKLRHGGDKAKLLSANDSAGFTFRGRFHDAPQAAGVSFEVTQKAHSALRWLVRRKQATRTGGQVFVCWALSGQSVPDIWANSNELFGVSSEEAPENVELPGDTGQDFAIRLRHAIRGYRSSISDTTSIVVMGLDSATPGRMALTFYQKLEGTDFLDRIERWHDKLAWPQNYGSGRRFTGAPSPLEIAEAAHGSRIDESLKKFTLERLLPCIVEGRPIPRDLSQLSFRKACNRVGHERKRKKSGKIERILEDEWEKRLGVACSLFKGCHEQRNYQMSLEEDRCTRDYLFGRLLAVAEHLEGRALYVSEETRETTAARLMQRFADRPMSTWRNIETALNPYRSRLRGKHGGFLHKMDVLLDEIISLFSTTDDAQLFTNDKPLSGEFLLGYHCQRQKLWERDGSDKTATDQETQEVAE